jgi:signal transduction histidine kinase
MMTEHDITRRYAYLATSTMVVTSLVLYVVIVQFPSLLNYRIWLLLAFLLLGSIGIWLVSRRFAAGMKRRIDDAYQSERAFISNASHEMNNPLTAIQGECEISLMRERTPAEYQAALGRIEHETERIIRLMKHLMFLSKGEADILKEGSEQIVLAEFLMQFMEPRIRFTPTDFRLEVTANPDLLRTALGNIIGNALKYSGDKAVELHIDGSVLEVRDYGIGIPPEDCERVIQPFYRAGNTREYAGNGIGLSLAAHILRIYGADVTLSSKLGDGTGVRIDFNPEI